VSHSRPSSDNPHAPAGQAPSASESRSYCIFDTPISSELPLPELPLCTRGAARLTVRRAGARGWDSTRFRICHEWRDGGRVICRSARGEEGYLLSFPQAEFLIAPDGMIACAPAPGVGEAFVRQLLLGQVLPRCLAHAGELVLHASAVTLPDGRTVAFVGESGYGKSTLAFYCRRSGARLIDDDCVLLKFREGGVGVSGGVPTVRLNADTMAALDCDPDAFFPVSNLSNKRQMRLADDPSREGASPSLDTLFLLDAPAGDPASATVSIAPARGQAAVMAAVRSAFNLDPASHDTMARSFRQVSRLLGAGLPVYHLRYPRDHALLPRVWQALLDHPRA